MKLCIIGTGYVGLVSGTCFADLGNDVICVDKDLNKIEKLKNGIIPIYEPGLEELVKKNFKSKRLNFSTSLIDAVSQSDIVFICVGTPTKKKTNAADLSQIFNVAKEIRNSISRFKIIITKSTVPVTTGDKIEKILLRKKHKKLFSVASNPEFLREGEAIRDFLYPDRVIIGTKDNKTNKILKNLYSPLISKGAKYINTSRRAAELIKYASNAFLATKITFINEIANLCEKIDIDIEDISIGIGLDKRIGGRFLRPGPAYGGSCFPKDTRAIVNTAKKFKTNLSLIDDMRESSSLKMMPFLSKKGSKINYFDPTGKKTEFNKLKNVSYVKNIKIALKNADLVIIHTEWNDFKSLNFKALIKKKNFIIFDMRNLYSSAKMKKAKIKYFGVGK